MDKSSLYCSGMKGSDVQRIIEALGLQISALPFRYLGVHICSKKILVAQCDGLVERMAASIRIWSTRHLCYSARMLLVNTVLMSLHQYWVQVFTLPKKVLQDIEKVCRAFLWVVIVSVTDLRILLRTIYVVLRLQEA